MKTREIESAAESALDYEALRDKKLNGNPPQSAWMLYNAFCGGLLLAHKETENKNRVT